MRLLLGIRLFTQSEDRMNDAFREQNTLLSEHNLALRLILGVICLVLILVSEMVDDYLDVVIPKHKEGVCN